MTTRRGFLGALLAAGIAPVIVRSDSIMKIAAPKIITPDNWASQDRVDRILRTNLCEEVYIDDLCDRMQMDRDRWFTPSERINARPFVSSRELKDAIYQSHVHARPLDERMLRDIRRMMHGMETA